MKTLKDIDIKNAGFAANNAAEWAKANGIEANWKTPEHIEVKPVYTKDDLEGMEHLNLIQHKIKVNPPERILL